MAPKRLSREGLPTRTRNKSETDDARERLQEDLGTSWVSGPNIGSGAFAQDCCLYLKQNRKGRIIDRFVFKNSDVEESMWPYWEQKSGATKTVPNEILAMRRLNDLEGAKETVVRLRNWRIVEIVRPKLRRNKHRMHLYLEFCPFGTVQSVAKAHKQWRENHGLARDRDTYIPEPWLWTLLESLATAGLLMQQGSLDAESDSEWDLIVHKDITSHNVLLGCKSSNTFRGYPGVPKLADFGKALVLRHGDDHITTSRNPQQEGSDEKYVNTDAPEEHKDKLEGQQDPDRFQRYSGQVNVWAVGHLMWALISGEDQHDCDYTEDEAQKPRDFDEEIAGEYSETLLDLVYQCLEYLPENRPTFTQILEHIRASDDDDEPKANVFHDLRNAGKDQFLWKRYGLNVDGKERYALRSMLKTEAAGDVDFPGTPPSPLRKEGKPQGSETYTPTSSDRAREEESESEEEEESEGSEEHWMLGRGEDYGKAGKRGREDGENEEDEEEEKQERETPRKKLKTLPNDEEESDVVPGGDEEIDVSSLTGVKNGQESADEGDNERSSQQRASEGEDESEDLPEQTDDGQGEDEDSQKQTNEDDGLADSQEQTTDGEDEDQGSQKPTKDDEDQNEDTSRKLNREDGGDDAEKDSDSEERGKPREESSSEDDEEDEDNNDDGAGPDAPPGQPNLRDPDADEDEDDGKAHPEQLDDTGGEGNGEPQDGVDRATSEEPAGNDDNYAASVPAVPAAVPYDEADAKQAWWDLEMETYRARKGRKGGPPTAKTPKAWLNISEDDRPAMFTAIQNWRASVAAFEAALEPVGPPAADDVTAVDGYISGQQEKISLLDAVLTNVGALITARGGHAEPEHTVAYLTRLRAERQADRDTRQILLDGVEQAQQDLPDADDEDDDAARVDWEEQDRNARNEQAVEDDEEQLKRARLLRAELDLSKGWIGGPVLGEGKFGKVTASFRQDSNGSIVDRVAIKDTDTASTHQTENMDVEVVAMYRLRALKGSSSVVAIRNYRPDNDGKRVRIFMEYCPYGTLWSLIKRYCQHNRVKPRDEPTAYLPEAFVWAVFESLAQAGMLMETGDLESDNPLSRNWELIVHRDFKAINIMLGNASQDAFRGYPQAKVGDFGAALTFSEQPAPLGTMTVDVGSYDKRSALEEMRKRYTNPSQHSAPEERNPKLEGAKTPPAFSSATNVWGVGMQIWGLIKKCRGDDDFLEDDEWSRPRGPRAFTPQQVQYYSPHLLKLVRQCVEYLPEERISFRDLLKQIRKRRSDERKTTADELRHARAGNALWGKHSLLLERERYALGLSLATEAENDEKWPKDDTFPLPPKPEPKPKRNDGESDSSDSDSSDDLGGPQGAVANLPPKTPTVDKPSGGQVARGSVGNSQPSSGSGGKRKAGDELDESDGPRTARKASDGER